MTPQEYINTIRQLIAKDQLSKALEQLHELLKNSPELDEAIMQSARFQAICKQIRVGIVSDKDADVSKNKIRKDLLDLLREIEPQGEQPEICTEKEQVTLTVVQNAEKIYNIKKIDKANFS